MILVTDHGYEGQYSRAHSAKAYSTCECQEPDAVVQKRIRHRPTGPDLEGVMDQ